MSQKKGFLWNKKLLSQERKELEKYESNWTRSFNKITTTSSFFQALAIGKQPNQSSEVAVSKLPETIKSSSKSNPVRTLKHWIHMQQFLAERFLLNEKQIEQLFANFFTEDIKNDKNLIMGQIQWT